MITNTNGSLDNINNNIFINPSNYVNGTSCDDGNVQTINDIYTNDVCAGTNVEGQSCDDGNAQTTNDTYHDGVCSGTIVANNTCTGGYTGDYNTNIYCANKGLTDSDLDNYIGLTSVNGDLFLHSNQLTNVNGLSNLTNISGYFYLYQNSNLVDLSGLQNITTLGGKIYINNHPSQFTTKIPTGSWLCNIAQQSKFDTRYGFLSQTDACESVTN